MEAGDGKPRRLNWGCGGYPVADWINSDLRPYPGVDLVCDIRKGLPLDSDSLDYAVSIHALPEVPYPDLLPTLSELRRVLRPEGTLRLGLPDMDRAIDAYLGKRPDYFLIPDEDAHSLGGKLIVQMIWYGHSRSIFTTDFVEELLMKAGFSRVERCSYHHTASPFPEIIQLDNREEESLFVEAFK